MRLPDRLRDRRVRVSLAVLLAIVTLALYLPVTHYGFIRLWDDDAYVTDNPHVRSGVKLENLKWAFTSFEQSNWHPLTWISHMVDCQLFGLAPGPQHFINLLLHALNVLLLFWILQKATGALGRSFVVAALFALHPLNVETVAWIAQRKSLLSAFFSLLTVAAYGWYAKQGGWKRYSAMLAAFALALMAKPMAVSLPLLLLLFDHWPLARFDNLPFSRRWVRLAIEKLPLFLMSAMSSVLTEMAQNSGGSVMGLSLLPLSTRIENAILAYVTYLGKILWPVRLAAYYPLQFSPKSGEVIASGVILVVISAAVIHFRRFRYLAVGWSLFLITLLPVIGIVQVGFQGMADRYTYIPAIGIFIAVVWAVAEVVKTAPVARFAASFAAVIAIAALSAGTLRYLRCWQDGVTLFAQARASWGQPDMWLEQLYGNALFSAGHTDEALDHYQQSCAIQPRTEYCHYNIAHILAGRGQWSEAIQQYQLALQFTASREMALLCLTESGEALLRLGQYEAAQRSATQALSIDPGSPTALELQQEIQRGKELGN